MWVKSVICFMLIALVAFLEGISCQVDAADVIAGRDITIDAMDRHEAVPDDELSCEPIRGTSAATSQDNTASFDISSSIHQTNGDGSTIGESSRAMSTVGVEVNWLSGSNCPMPDIEKMPVNVTIDYSYHLQADNTGCCGHANSYLYVFSNDNGNFIDNVSSINQGLVESSNQNNEYTFSSTIENVHALHTQTRGEVCTRSMPAGHVPGPAHSSSTVTIHDISFSFPQYICTPKNKVVFVAFKGDGNYEDPGTGDIDILNNGSENLNVSQAVVVSPSSGFEIVSDGCLQRSPLGLFDHCSIAMKFSPQDSAVVISNLVVPSNDTLRPNLTIMLIGITITVSEEDEDDESEKEDEIIEYIRKTVFPYEVHGMPVEIPAGLPGVVFSNAWAGSDIELTMRQPDNVLIHRGTVDEKIDHVKTDTSETYYIKDPMPGTWQVTLNGLDVPQSGEESFLSVSAVKNRKKQPLIFIPSLLLDN